MQKLKLLLPAALAILLFQNCTPGFSGGNQSVASISSIGTSNAQPSPTPAPTAEPIAATPTPTAANSTPTATPTPVATPASTGSGYDGPVSSTSSTMVLSNAWKFAEDPSNIGATSNSPWFSASFNDSSWTNLLSGKSWESQSIKYSGFGWYRQEITIPSSAEGAPIVLNLPSIYSDDVVWFNGMQIGGITGNYKYNNLLPRQYVVPTEYVKYGTTNTLAIRVWGGNLEFQGANSGLISGTYSLVLNPFTVMARNANAPDSSDQPIQLYDLSGAQQGGVFEIVFRYPSSLLPSASAHLTYTISDFYGNALSTNQIVVNKSSVDGYARGVVSVTPALSQSIYFAGRIKAALSLTDAATGKVILSSAQAMDHLNFHQRDSVALAALPEAYESTPYGSLKLVDTIDCSTPLNSEPHPYMQSAFGDHSQDYSTPGVPVSVPVNTILGKSAREPAYGWFAYRIGRGAMVAGKTYLLRIEYPEDKPRYSPIEIQSGHNYFDVGWKNSLSSDNPYGNYPLSNTWQYYDAIVTLGSETTGTGGVGDANSASGFWVYVMNKMKPGYYFKLYSGGPAVATMKLYEIDPAANAPNITLPPAGIAQRTLMFDWEHQADQKPIDIVNYAKLMGYSAVSPVMLKWGLGNWGEPIDGYSTTNVDGAGYWSANAANPAVAAVPGTPSVHQQYLDATREAGLNYIPRIEYGGSNNLPVAARSINKAGAVAAPNRFTPSWGANLLNASTLTDYQYLLDRLIKPYTATNPQLKGILWRIRQDRMQISYGAPDVAMFSQETKTAVPAGLTGAKLSAWASGGTVGAAYADWWHQKRASFHRQLVSGLQAYRSDLKLFYFNWDPDKFSLLAPEINSATFYGKFSSPTAATNAYETDIANRKLYTDADYINVMNTGDFSASGSGWANRPDCGIRPSLYSAIPGVEILAPANSLAYAGKANYLNYFQTADGLAVSNTIAYDEIAAREPNPKYEGNMMTDGGSAFSMSVELLSYFYGDAQTLTYTAYTYGRGFADAHRRFASAYLALPAQKGTVISGTNADTMARTYKTSNGTYLGVASKAYAESSLTINIPGAWTSKTVVTNLVTKLPVLASVVGGNLQISFTAGPMELNSFLISN